MTAEDVIAKFEARGVRISLTADGTNLDIDGFGKLTNEDRHYLKCYKSELLWRLRHPQGDPEIIVTSDLCPDCGAVMASDDDDHYERLTCPAGCVEPYPRFIRRRNAPHINADGDLIILFTSPVKYHHWKPGGQSIWATLAELNAPLSTWRKYAYERPELLDGSHDARCSTKAAQAENFLYCTQCGWFAETARESEPAHAK
jgi:hypothetical protein